HEGWHEIDVLARIGLGGELAALWRRGEQAQPVAQPLHCRAGDEDGALQRIGALTVELIGNRGEQSVARGNRPSARVDGWKAACGVSGRGHGGGEAGLADGGRLLVASDTLDGDGSTENGGFRDAEVGVAVAHFGQDGTGHVKEREEILVEGTRGN